MASGRAGWGPGSTFPWVPPYTLTSPGTSIQTPQSHASSPSSGQQVLDTRNWSIYPYQLTFPVSSAPHPGGPQSDEISPRTPTTDPLWPGQQQNGNPAPQAGQEYTIPSPLQRFLAETVDFFILFCVKATIVLCIMRLSGMKDFAKFIIQFIVEEIDENTSMEDLQKMMAVALVHRVLVCVYETVCIWSAGGATPGKFLLGLRVVTCDTSTLVRPNRVLVVPATNVSLSASTVRALNKNFSIAFLFPIFITLLFFQHNRTVYDIVAGTIVVQRRRDR
ncbi:protein FAM8A1 isoform X2 [Sphaeramia orbicularis]|uniref:protein FAM8A1 isoform X2 n=1 Tax=Sphaeramia orbicularis TaxID=375764 RepID=UPI00117DA00E|nr:protein FAM8A1-like isoform X2 [Sphaeramia orbicularis]